MILGTSSLFINFILTTDFSGVLNWLHFDIKGILYKYFHTLFILISFQGEDTIFYLMPFCVFEFAIGAILIWLTHLRPKRKLISEIYFWDGQWIFYDEIYLSKLGSIYFAEYIKSQILRFLLNT
jgi:hypothetical protein